MGSLPVQVRNAFLDALARGVAFANSAIWVKLHIGDPGSSGTANPAANTTRMQAVFGSAAASGAISNTVAVTWPSVPASETYTHATLWSDQTSGIHLGTDQLSEPTAVVIGDTFVIPIGDLVLELT